MIETNERSSWLSWWLEWCPQPTRGNRSNEAGQQEVREPANGLSCRHEFASTRLQLAMEFRLVTADGVDEAYALETASFPPDEAASLESLR